MFATWLHSSSAFGGLQDNTSLIDLVGHRSTESLREQAAWGRRRRKGLVSRLVQLCCAPLEWALRGEQRVHRWIGVISPPISQSRRFIQAQGLPCPPEGIQSAASLRVRPPATALVELLVVCGRLHGPREVMDEVTRHERLKVREDQLKLSIRASVIGRTSFRVSAGRKRVKIIIGLVRGVRIHGCYSFTIVVHRLPPSSGFTADATSETDATGRFFSDCWKPLRAASEAATLSAYERSLIGTV